MNTRKRTDKRKKSGKPGRRSKPVPDRNPAGNRQSAQESEHNRENRDHSRSKPAENWLFGTHAVLAALANPARRCHHLLITSETLRRLEPELEELVPAGLAADRCDRATISEQLPPDAVHQGIALQCDPLPDPSLEDILDRHAEGDSIVVVLDQITDPHNVGAILRSAAGFGAHAVIMQDRNAPPASGTLAKSASGALELVPLVRVTNLARTLETLAEQDYWRIGLAADGEQTLAASQPGKRTALVMGAEGSGLRRLTAEKCDQICRLPMVEAARLTSLNVSNAAAIALYELVRH